MRLSIVRASFCAAHKDVLSGQNHGHSWEVTAWFSADPRRDLRVLKETLAKYCSALDHKQLEDVLPGEVCDEAISEWIGQQLQDRGCVRLRLWRPVEGIGGEWVK